MSSAKTERLVNLTMALLASRRYLKKSEIFQKVAGYSGSSETKERMFERDKDDLRALGIEIEVASHDPLFEDEPGYRIKPEKFQFPLQSFTHEELALMSTALGMWAGTGFDSEAIDAQRRISTQIALENFSFSNQYSEFLEVGLVELSRALSQRSSVAFTYQKSPEHNPETRQVNPLGLSGWRGSWYLVGEDLAKEDIRVFKLSRITSAIEISKKRGVYQIPEDFNIKDYLIMYSRDLVQVSSAIKKGAAQEIRRRALSTVSHPEKLYASEWDIVSYSSESLSEAIKEALWLCDSLVALDPPEFRNEVQSRLKTMRENHG